MFKKENLKKIINELAESYEAEKILSNLELLEICKREGFEGFTNEQDNRLAHELAEVAANIQVSKRYCRSKFKENNNISEILSGLENLEKRMPLQSWRSSEQARLQQFSTPPSVAFLMTKILNPAKTELILEPSAGTGSLAAWLRISECDLQLNELSKRRRALLELQDYEPMGYDAEFLDDVLPEEIQPEGILMNPPFSSSSGRTKNNDAGFGFRHVRAALSRLKDGGRLVTLLGTESGTQTAKARKFWGEIADRCDLRAIIHLPKNAFRKYGTSVGTSIVCVVKNHSPGSENRNKKK